MTQHRRRYEISMLPVELAQRIEEVDGCWEWQGTRSKLGYGNLSWKGRTIGVHRLVWTLLVDPELPPGSGRAQFDHLCENPPCCNPAHLEIVSSRINNLRKWRCTEQTPFIGVYRKGRKWEVRCYGRPVTSFIGSFIDPRHAYEAYMRCLDDIDPVAGLEARRLSGPTKWPPRSLLYSH